MIWRSEPLSSGPSRRSPMRSNLPPCGLCAWRFGCCDRDIGWKHPMKDFGRATRIWLPAGFFFWEERNPGNLREVLTNLSDECGVTVQSIHSSLPDTNRRGIGSEEDFPLKSPKVAVLADEPGEQTSYGLLLFLLEQKYGLEVVPVSIEKLTRDVFDRINVLLLPDGEASRYKKAFDEDQLGNLREWISHGGVLICLGGASEFAADPDTKLSPTRIVGSDEKPDASADKPSADPHQKQD